MCAEETRSLKTVKESQSFPLQPADHQPEGQSQKQWVKNPCPDFPKHLDTKMVPQPLKESGEYQESGDIREEGQQAGGKDGCVRRRDVQSSRPGLEQCLMDTLRNKASKPCQRLSAQGCQHTAL